MRIAYLDCFAGLSGDMFLGALLGAGVPLPVLEAAVAALGLDASLRVETVDRSGISSLKVHVLEAGELAEAPHKHGPGKHEHPHEHARSHDHEHQHDHEHSHDHEGSHDHELEHENANHKYTHEHATHEHPHEHERYEHAAHGHELEHKHEKHSHEPGHEHPNTHEHEHPHAHGRSLSVIRELIRASSLAEPVKQRAIHTFELLGHSEAKIHNVPVERIHFHEVGAVDAIIDIVAACAGIEHLQSEESVRWFASPVNVGGGIVQCAHGTFPVPAPATADLLRGLPTYAAHIEKELVTPTGAALLRMLDPEFGPQPAMRVARIGYGAGTRNPKGFPNVLRLSLGDSAGEAAHPPGAAKAHHAEPVTVLETALDDLSPQVLAYAAEQALAQGALDVMLTPVIMKKGRPGTLITVLCHASEADTLETLLLRETSTLGVRRRQEHRTCLDRTHHPVETEYGTIRVKVGSRGAETLNAAPEFEDCRNAAARDGVAVKQVIQAAIAAFEPIARTAPKAAMPTLVNSRF